MFPTRLLLLVGTSTCESLSVNNSLKRTLSSEMCDSFCGPRGCSQCSCSVKILPSDVFPVDDREEEKAYVNGSVFRRSTMACAGEKPKIKAKREYIMNMYACLLGGS